MENDKLKELDELDKLINVEEIINEEKNEDYQFIPPLSDFDDYANQDKVALTLRDRVLSFMKETSPIFETGIRNGVDPFFFAGDGQLPKALNMTLDLSKRIAETCFQKKPTSSEINAFRYVSSLIVSEVMSSDEEDAEDNFNSDDLIKDMGETFKIVRKNITDIDTNKIINHDACISISSMKMAAMLIPPILIYDFRKSKTELVSKMTHVILKETLRIAPEIVQNATDDYSRWKIMEHILDTLTRFMVQSYEKQARHFATVTAIKTEVERQNMFAEYDPLKEIEETFQGYTKLFFETMNIYIHQLMRAHNK